MSKAGSEKPLLAQPLGVAGTHVLGRIIQNNYFYFFSAAFMLLGSYLLMPSSAIYSDNFARDHFPRVFKSLMILQAYEVLVIATAVMIARRLRALDDGFNLLLIEILLLLDPTFFANNFATMQTARSFTVNFVCFALVPIKMMILQRGLRIRLSRNGWYAFIFAALFVYLAEWPLSREVPFPGFSPEGYFYLITFGPLAFAYLLPGVKNLAGSVVPDKEYLSEHRRTILNRTFLFLPLIVIGAHLIETSRVHEIIICGLHVAPLLLAIGIFTIKNRGEMSMKSLMFRLDVSCLTALVLSAGPYRIRTFSQSVDVPDGVSPLPAFMDGGIPLVLCAVTAICIYYYAYRATNYRPAFRRVVVLCVVGLTIGLIRLDVVNTLLDSVWVSVKFALSGVRQVCGAVIRLLGKGIGFLMEHSFAYLIPGIVILAAIAHKFRNKIVWFLLGLVVIWIVFGLLPEDRVHWAREIVQCIIIMCIILDHVFHARPNKTTHYAFAVLAAWLGITRFGAEPAVWSGCFAFSAAVALIAVGFRYKYMGYIVIGLAQSAILALIARHFMHYRVSAAATALGGGVFLFLIGILVTFNKWKIITWMESGDKGLGSISDDVKRRVGTSITSAEPNLFDEEFPAGEEEEGEKPKSESAGEEPGDEPEPVKPVSPAKGAITKTLERKPQRHTAAVHFLNQPDFAVVACKSMPQEVYEEIVSSIEWEADEYPLMCFARDSGKPLEWEVLLSNRRLIYRSPERSS